MPKIRYQKIKLGPDKLEIIHKANVLIARYQAAGYTLSLRQLYYQFVAKDLFPDSWINAEYNAKNNLAPNTKNTQKNYSRLGDVIGDARMAGLLDWEAIEDRTREVDAVPHWETPAEILKSAHGAFRVDKWTTQKKRIEVWVEKDAIEGIAKQAAHAQDVAVFSCRGYSSLSSLWQSANRLKAYVKAGQKPIILHIGDHDPSGIDMTRDISERLNTFVWTDLILEAADAIEEAGMKRSDIKAGMMFDWLQRYGITAEQMEQKDVITVERIALTMEQVEEYNPPPNPAKATDARYKKYQAIHGEESWELDALEPAVLDTLITASISKHRDDIAYDKRYDIEVRHRTKLKAAADHWLNGLAEVVAGYKPPKPKKGK